MDRYCQNPLCENEAVREEPISVNSLSDQKLALCAACREVYDRGVQQGRMISLPKKVWVLAVTYKGTTVHARAFRRRRRVLQGLVKYLRVREGYPGPADMGNVLAWLTGHDERLGVDIFAAPLEAS